MSYRFPVLLAVVFMSSLQLLDRPMAQPSGCYLRIDDPVDDDYGPGAYVYPTDQVFTPGSFDLTYFEVSCSSQTVFFDMGIAGQIEDPWSSGSGFSLQSIDIYIDKDGVDSSGAMYTLEARNATVSSGSAWEQMIWCAPPFDGFTTVVIDQYGGQDASGVSVSVDTVLDRISISIPEQTIGEPDSGWAYIVLMLGQDGYSPGRVRPVRQHESQWIFGGGDDSSYDANIIDMVVMPTLSQEAMLSGYDPEAGVRPVLRARPDTAPPLIIHTPVTTAEEHLPVEVAAKVLDDAVSQSLLYYRIVGEQVYVESEMVRVSPDSFHGEIPGEAVTLDGLEYFLYATDGINESTAPSDTSLSYQIAVSLDVTAPSVFNVSAHPNPFSPDSDGYRDTTLISWTLTEPSFMTVTVYDSLLQVKRILLQDELYSSGQSTTSWDGEDESGEIVDNGRYPVRLEAEDLAGHPSPSPAEIEVIVDTTAGRELEVIFLFHFNQNLVPYGKVANTACYVGLLETLRDHPQSKFLIHISGSLIHDLLWFDDRAIELIREGVQDGQFEILGSTYVQNVMYSTRVDSLDFQFNDEQVKLHRRVIEEVFQVTPKGFWNPERTWTQNFAQLLSDNGYDYVQVEDHILFESGISGSEYLVRTTSYNGRDLIVFDDDKHFQGWANYVIDSGDYQGLIDFLHQTYDEDSLDQYAVCYHEDAEATGLWDYEGGQNPESNWEHLDSLITLVEGDPELRMTTYDEWLAGHQPAEEVTPIVDGAASWMGGDSWFAENDSPNMHSYRTFYDAIRNRLNEVADTIAGSSQDTLASSRLLRHAWQTLCAHQYEFGCHGLTEHAGFTDFDLARCALVVAEAALYAAIPTTSVYQDDLNDDGVVEVVLVTQSDMWVLSPYGGRLLYWFDLESGDELVGNENFMYYGEPYISDSRYVPALEGGSDVYSWLSGNYIFPEVFQWTFEIRRRALSDWMEVDGGSLEVLANELYSVNIGPDSVVFTYSTPELDIVKSIRPEDASLGISYTITNSTPSPLGLTLRNENGFSPSYIELLDHGRQSLKYWNGVEPVDSVDPSVMGVINIFTGKKVLCDFVSSPTRMEGGEVVFGLELNPVYEFDLAGYETDSIVYRLTREEPDPPFLRGDADGDLDIGMDDGIFLLRYLYVPGHPEPSCAKSGDTDDSGELAISDPVYLLRYLYVPAAPPPPAPFPECGSDMTPDGLTCTDHACASSRAAKRLY